jgi:hypothetical protein
MNTEIKKQTGDPTIAGRGSWQNRWQDHESHGQMALVTDDRVSEDARPV